MSQLTYRASTGLDPFVFKAIMEMRNFPGLLSNYENAVAHAQQTKLLSDGIVIGELQSSISDSPVPERGGEGTLGSNGDSNNPLLVQEVVFDPHWINQLAVKSDDFVRCPGSTEWAAAR